MKLKSSALTRVNTSEASLVVDVKSVDFKITFQFLKTQNLKI